jgi:branched-chain amino acid transport system substrate-binding protein
VAEARSAFCKPPVQPRFSNLLEQARHLDIELPMLLPGVRFTVSPDNYRPIRNIRLQVFKDDRWALMDE